MARIDSRDATPYDDCCLTCSKLGSHSWLRSVGFVSLAYWPAPAPMCHVASTAATPARRPCQAGVSSARARLVSPPAASEARATEATRARFIENARGGD